MEVRQTRVRRGKVLGDNVITPPQHDLSPSSAAPRQVRIPPRQEELDAYVWMDCDESEPTYLILTIVNQGVQLELECTATSKVMYFSLLFFLIWN